MKLSGNLRETLRGAAPVVGSVLGGLANEEYSAGKMLPRVDRGPRKVQSGNFLAYRADANFGDLGMVAEVPLGMHFPSSNTRPTVLIPYAMRRYGRNCMMDEMEIRDLPLMDELDQVATLEAQAQPTIEDLRIERQGRVAALYTTAGNFTTTAASALGWANPATDIIAEIDARIAAVRAFGRRCNTFYASEPVRATLRTAPQILAFLNVNDNRNRLNDDAVVAFLKDTFNFDNVQFDTSVANTVNTAAGALVPGFIWPRTVFLGYIPASNGAAGQIGRVAGDNTQLTPSATYGMGGDDTWTAEYIDIPDQPHLLGYNFRYEETFGVLQAQLGTTLTAV